MNRSWMKRLGASLALAALGGALAGCVVEPARPYYYHPHPYYYGWR